MSYKLIDFAEIILGHTFRGAIVECLDGNYYALQARNIKADGNLSEFLRIDIELSRTKGFVKQGDVILSNRGSFRAAVYLGEKSNILATSSVYILRVDKKNIIPEYLSVYFNSEIGQIDLQGLSQSTLIKSLSKSDLSNLRIPVPTLERQKKIIAIHTNYSARKKLYKKKSEIYENITSYTINHLITS